ncbi:MAG: hypothetical protein CR984_03330 [Proteobacteria bacterium]|nr:MAG: hypothetical protein CR984_03330 [Pseudomonadota bacterium]
MPNKNNPNPPFPPLQTNGKNRFPFAVACPSFVHRAGYRDNVRALADFVDEIQLLFFESRAESIPSHALIRELGGMAAEKKIGYQVHLPSDVHPGHPDPGERRRAADAWATIIDRCTPLGPSTFTLHLSRNPQDSPPISDAQWRANLQETIKAMLPTGLDHGRISAESLDYPLDWVAPVITATGLSVCMDMGHLLVHGENIVEFYRRWKTRVTTIHLHGVDGHRDHLPLNRLAAHQMAAVLQILNTFTGGVTLEVYSHAALDASLGCLAAHWSGGKRRRTTRPKTRMRCEPSKTGKP